MRILDERAGFKTGEEGGDEDVLDYNVEVPNQEPNLSAEGVADEESRDAASPENGSTDNSDTTDLATGMHPESEESSDQEDYKAHHELSTTLSNSSVSVDVEIHDQEFNKNCGQATQKTCENVSETPELHSDRFPDFEEPSDSEERKGHDADRKTCRHTSETAGRQAEKVEKNESGNFEEGHDFDKEMAYRQVSSTLDSYLDDFSADDEATESGRRKGNDRSVSTKENSSDSEAKQDNFDHDSAHEKPNESEFTEQNHHNDSTNMKSNESRNIEEVSDSDSTRDNANKSRITEEGHDSNYTNEKSKDPGNIEDDRNDDTRSTSKQLPSPLENKADKVSLAKYLKQSDHTKKHHEVDMSELRDFEDTSSVSSDDSEYEPEIIETPHEIDPMNFHHNLSIIFESNADSASIDDEFEESGIIGYHKKPLRKTFSNVSSQTAETISAYDGSCELGGSSPYITPQVTLNGNVRSAETIPTISEVVFNSHSPRHGRKNINRDLLDVKDDLQAKRRRRRDSSASASCVPTQLYNETSYSFHTRQSRGRSSSLPILHPPLDARNSFLRSLPPALSKTFKKKRVSDAVKGLALIVSAMYGKMIMIMGMAFPLAEIISEHVSDSYYEIFYMYLYFGSILFLLYVNFFILKVKSAKRIAHGLRLNKDFAMDCAMSVAASDSTSRRASIASLSDTGLPKQRFSRSTDNEFGSNLYLRIGACAFGVGAVVYAILEFSQLLELYILDICHNFPMTVSPALRCIFIFLQMYFIFLNSRILIQRYVIIARFGLIHVIATNVCTSFDVVVNQSKHEILAYAMKKIEDASNHDGNSTLGTENVPLIRHRRGTIDAKLQGDECWSSSPNNILSQLVSNAAPFFYPHTIEYSLICATVLCLMWKNIGRGNKKTIFEEDDKSQHKYTLDCSKAHKGVFIGILIFVLTIVSVILFFALVEKEEYRDVAILEKNVAELLLYIVGIVAVAVAYVQMNSLQYDIWRNFEIEYILLIAAQAGLYLYAVYLIIGGYFNINQDATMAVLIGLTKLIQATMQTVFILDASRRRASNQDDEQNKPGRNCVMLLLLANVSMWMMNKTEMSSAVHCAQVEFYGQLGWTILSHMTMPLALFYRVHSTVCLCDIWTRAYKIKQL